MVTDKVGVGDANDARTTPYISVRAVGKSRPQSPVDVTEANPIIVSTASAIASINID